MRGDSPPRRRALRVAAVVGLVLASLVASARADRLLVRTYSLADGLSSERGTCLVVDHDGFLWICSQDGVSRFDGSSFAHFGPNEGLPRSVVNDLLQTRSGERWVATNGDGVALFDAVALAPGGSAFAVFPVGESSRTMRVNRLFETSEGALFAGTDGGLFRSRQQGREARFRAVPLDVPAIADGDLQVWALAEGTEGAMWLGTSAGLLFLPRIGPATQYPVAPVQGADQVYDVMVDEEQRLWIAHDLGLVIWLPGPSGTSVTGLADAPVARGPLLERSEHCLSRGTRPSLALPETPGSSCRWSMPGDGLRRRVYDLARTPDGTFWATSAGRLAAFTRSGVQVYGEQQGLPHSTPAWMAVDRDGDLWVASLSGLARILRRGGTLYTVDDGLVEPVVERLFEPRAGQLLAVTASGWIHRFEEGRWVPIRPNLPADAGVAGRSRYGAVLVDRQGRWWAGTGEGLYRFAPVPTLEGLEGAEPEAHYTTSEGLAGNDVWRLFEDSRGDLWIASRVPSREPLTRWQRTTGTLQAYGRAQGLPERRAVQSFAEDRCGGLWVGFFDGGLARFDGESFRSFLLGSELDGSRVSSLLVDRLGRLWVGGTSVLRCDAPCSSRPSFRRPDLTPGGGEILAEDDRGWLYVSTSRGLVRVQPDGVGRHEVGVGTPFADGRFGYRSRDGTLWFGTTSGVLRYRPRPPGRGSPPPVWIAHLSVAGEAIPVSLMGARDVQLARLEDSRGRLEIGYFGLGFGLDQPLRFQYRLNDIDDDWSPATEQRHVVYAGLGPGRYDFRVRALAASGAMSAMPATVSFEVPPALWRRGWFLALMVAVLVSVLAAVYRERVGRLLEVERVRTRIAADLHDDLGASLSRIALLGEVARRGLREDPEGSEELLSEIGDTARELVDAAGDIAYAIDAGRERLDAFAARIRRYAEDLLAGSGIEWRFDWDEREPGHVLRSDQRRHLLAILKEGLRNAVEHGRPDRIVLELKVVDDALVVELADDGRGFDPRSTGGPAAAGQGIGNMTRRARELGGELEVDTAPEVGTSLRLRMPLGSAGSRRMPML